MTTAEVYHAIRPRYPELVGKVALVTGSSKGIGKGIALRLAREGMRVIIHGLDNEEVVQAVEEFRLLGADTFGVCSDFASPHGVDLLFDAVRARYTEVTLLVNNAADLRRTGMDLLDVELLDRQIEVNIRAPLLCSIQARSMMQPGQASSIINISSVGGQRAHLPGLPYDMTKGALEAMTRAMALDLAKDGIRVNAVAPGATRGWRTPPPDDARFKAICARIPLGRFGSDQDVAAMVAFLASADAGYVTGQVFAVDGGISAQLSPPGQPI